MFLSVEMASLSLQHLIRNMPMRKNGSLHSDSRTEHQKRLTVFMTNSEELDRARYVAFISFRQDGTPVNTPVWIIAFEDGYAFTTDPASFKVERVRRQPRVTIQVCDVRGRIRPDSKEYSGRAEVITGERCREVERLVRRKYRIGIRLLDLWEAVSRLARRGPSAPGAIKVVLDEN